MPRISDAQGNEAKLNSDGSLNAKLVGSLANNQGSNYNLLGQVIAGFGERDFIGSLTNAGVFSKGTLTIAAGANYNSPPINLESLKNVKCLLLYNIPVAASSGNVVVNLRSTIPTIVDIGLITVTGAALSGENIIQTPTGVGPFLRYGGININNTLNVSITVEFLTIITN